MRIMDGRDVREILERVADGRTSVDEAVLQMELLGHTFFAFKDVDQDGRFSVVYKRNDGDYGLIEDDA